jgi:hypothetical protein
VPARSVGEIREFVAKVWHSLLAMHYEYQRKGADFRFVVTNEFVLGHLHKGEHLNEANADVAEDKFRLYAGEQQSHHKQEAADPFGGDGEREQPTQKKRRIVVTADDMPRSVYFGGPDPDAKGKEEEV